MIEGRIIYEAIEGYARGIVVEPPEAEKLEKPHEKWRVCIGPSTHNIPREFPKEDFQAVIEKLKSYLTENLPPDVLADILPPKS